MPKRERRIVNNPVIMVQIALEQEDIDALNRYASNSPGKTWEDWLPFVAMMETSKAVGRIRAKYLKDREEKRSEFRNE